ncbi:AAA family ATPase [Stieleria varia]|uniref:Rad50/SbcC-type AAA domain-containing protein n=1 Tax=Stieleria varia TaxID=2528005 RepID=A0A5C6BA97_9BACT|nr:AAA family ATPase [Stieleria varia]TWU08196.1 hypothetical protein Pla52n_07780 [Stieleria varia]
MKVKDIQIDGFGVWTGLSVDSLSDGMTLFYGPNEAGKTTLMQFIRAMFYGFTPGRREKYLPPLHGGTPGGALRVTGPGGGYEIRRHSQLSGESVTGQLTVTGSDGLSQGQHRLNSLLGQIDEPIFTNVFAIGMRELQELSTLDDTKAADELYKLSSGLDRVSLVDVIRSLREGRQQLIGESRFSSDPDIAKLAGLIQKRDRLRDEVQQLSSHSRRWNELASQRRTQLQEINDLTERMGNWEKEARCVEAAISVYESWTRRDELREQIKLIEVDARMPDEAPGKLVQIDATIEDRRAKLEEVKQKRRALREKSEQLPVSKRMLDLQGRIEAATEQATWVEALEEQIEKVDQQILKARSQLTMDADRLGLDQSDRESLLEGETSQLPDLSRQTLAALAGPAKRVKEHAFALRQARNEGAEHKKRCEQYGEQLTEVLERAHASELQQAIRRETDVISALKHRLQLGEHLEKLKRHYRSLENESVDLTTAEVLPLDRLLLLALPFIVGGSCLVYAFSHLTGLSWFLSGEPDATTGVLYMMFGTCALLVYFISRQNGQRSTLGDLEDCDRQIDTLRRQIREIEAERDSVDSNLPTSSQSIEVRIRESESLLAELEASLPAYHAHQAASQSYDNARRRATKAADQLKQAKREWASTLEQLGLAETMSPSSVRKLSEGYETLQASLRRLEELQAEKDQRRRERSSIAKRIEMLYLEALEINEESAAAERKKFADDDLEDSVADSRKEKRQVAMSIDGRNIDSRNIDSRNIDGRNIDGRDKRASRLGPLEQLHHLQEELSRQNHWIKRRRDLREQDQQYKRQQSAYARTIERSEQQRRALWAKCGVATPEQFYQLLDNKAGLVELKKQFKDIDKQIRSMIGANVDYDVVQREITDTQLPDLEKRWETITGRVSETETRIGVLRTQQGELAAEMKHLADDKRLMTAQLELSCVGRQIDSVARRWQTLATASFLVEEVCGKFERERQPETLREASSFLSQLTDGKYTRVWTPLGTNQLNVDAHDGSSLSLDVLSRGTREAVFIALRLSLAAAYSRRGVMLPLVLDDVLVNFDGQRALHAAETLRTFAELGHQVLMFTCHEHIVEIFHSIGVEVRQMPPQGTPGRATILEPTLIEYEEEEYEEEEEYVEEEPVYEEEVVAEAPVAESPVVQEPVVELPVVEKPVLQTPPKPAPQPDPRPAPKPEPVRVVVEPEPRVIYVERPREEPKRPRAQPIRIVEPEPTAADDYLLDEPDEIRPQHAPSIGWAWFERESIADAQLPVDEFLTPQPVSSKLPIDQLSTEQRAAQALKMAHHAINREWFGHEISADEPADAAAPEEVWNRNGSWWDGAQVTKPSA